ncbi:hypothetical protein JMG10_47710 [Nostoc ellipsosporum NOK]|nr:hypothetical protein [Nostoc ellipsosporum NOK]
MAWPVLRALGRLEEALLLAEDVARAAEAGGEEAPYIHEELAECQAGLGDRQRAPIAARLALAVLGNDPIFADREPRRLARLRELAGCVRPTASPGTVACPVRA